MKKFIWSGGIINCSGNVFWWPLEPLPPWGLGTTVLWQTLALRVGALSSGNLLQGQADPFFGLIRQWWRWEQSERCNWCTSACPIGLSGGCDGYWLVINRRTICQLCSLITHFNLLSGHFSDQIFLANQWCRSNLNASLIVYLTLYIWYSSCLDLISIVQVEFNLAVHAAEFSKRIVHTTINILFNKPLLTPTQLILLAIVSPFQIKGSFTPHCEFNQTKDNH